MNRYILPIEGLSSPINKRLRNTLYVGESLFLSGSKYAVLWMLPFFVSPALFGEYNLAMIVATYATNLNFGLFNALPQRLPACKDKDSVQQVLSNVASLNLIITLVSVVSALVLGYAVGPHALAYTFLFLGGFYFNFLYQLKRGLDRFAELGQLKLVLGFSNLALCVVVILGGYSWFLAFSTVFALGAVIIFARSDERSMMFGRWDRFDRNIIMGLLRVGFPIMCLGLLGSVQITFDRVIIAFFRPVEDVGYYSVGALFLAAVMLFPGSIFEIYYAHFARGMAAGDETQIRNQFHRQLKYTMGSTVVLVLAGSLLLPKLITHFLPNYSEAIPVIWWSLATSFFLVIATNYSNLFTAVLRSRVSLFNTLVVILIGVVSNIVILVKGFGITAVSANACICSIILCLAQAASYKSLYSTLRSR